MDSALNLGSGGGVLAVGEAPSNSKREFTTEAQSAQRSEWK